MCLFFNFNVKLLSTETPSPRHINSITMIWSSSQVSSLTPPTFSMSSKLKPITIGGPQPVGSEASLDTELGAIVSMLLCTRADRARQPDQTAANIKTRFVVMFRKGQPVHVEPINNNNNNRFSS
ncbi:hypothetical protein ElyMa_003131800 [Elysia marginata]|uniref:Uncharacterized protein n=1 Tax=Elysia marginata TaxID=1093978 RepID=A0AAV4ITE9_9GAST|nr:hypothetical protein ElyMa_003131800 [Elysia marginata]